MRTAIQGFIALAALTFAGCACAQETIPMQKTDSGQGAGRYQIIINPNVRADTFMIDTATGRVWNLQDLKDGEQIWVPLRRRPWPE